VVCDTVAGADALCHQHGSLTLTSRTSCCHKRNNGRDVNLRPLRCDGHRTRAADSRSRNLLGGRHRGVPGAQRDSATPSQTSTRFADLETNDKCSGFVDRRLPADRSRASSARASRPSRTTDQICGRRLMRVKRRAPISCRHCCRRKEPLPSDCRSRCRVRRRSSPVLRADRDNFRDNRGDRRQACKWRSRLYLAFSPR
jgi:hypothetical protein